MANQVVEDSNPVPAPRHVYEKPTLQRLGLLRLMTRYSHAGEPDDDSWERFRLDD
jgi:hypothetical protein